MGEVICWCPRCKFESLKEMSHTLKYIERYPKWIHEVLKYKHRKRRGTMAKAKTAVRAVEVESSPPSALKPGTGSSRVKFRLVVIYGPPGAGKTHSCSNLKGAKWVISDSNAVPTLQALDRLPPDEDIYEVSNLAEARELAFTMADALASKSESFPAVVFDSLTTLNDYHQADVAKATGQEFMGQNDKNNGWQAFNDSFGKFIDALGELARFTNVIVICHAKDNPNRAKGEFAGLNLSPQMAIRMARVANWVLFQSVTSQVLDTETAKTAKSDAFSQVIEGHDCTMRITRMLHTQPVGIWTVKVNAKHLDAEEVPDVAALLKKEKLL